MIPPHLAPQVCRVLLEMGHGVTVITGAPAGIFIRELPSACLAVRKAALDFGAKQKDAFSVDMAGAHSAFLAAFWILDQASPLHAWRCARPH